MASQLLSQKKPDVAVTTLTKSLKYLEQAALEAQQSAAPDSVRSVIVRAIAYNGKEVTKLLPQLPDTDRASIQKLLDENVVIANSLK